LIVWQPFVDQTHAEKLKETLSAVPSERELVRFAVGGILPTPTVTVNKMGGNTFLLSSMSHDLRVLDIRALGAESCKEQQCFGFPLAALGIFAGQGPNLIHAFSIGKRTVLLNGTHRVFALRSLGVTHVPCVVQYLSNDEDLDLVGVPELKSNYSLYFESPRPPLFKDYFNRHLYKLLPVTPVRNTLEVEIRVRQSRLPL
jgi:hypothetical protein